MTFLAALLRVAPTGAVIVAGLLYTHVRINRRKS